MAKKNKQGAGDRVDVVTSSSHGFGTVGLASERWRRHGP